MGTGITSADEAISKHQVSQGEELLLVPNSFGTKCYKTFSGFWLLNKILTSV